LGELVIKEEGGKYKLSSFGKASVSMMKGAEEVPDSHAKRFAALPLRWKSLFGMLAIAILLLGSMSFIQYSTLGTLAFNFANLQSDYDRIKAENDQFHTWSSSASLAMNMLKNVIQINVSKYHATLEDTSAEGRPDLGGIIEEINKYSLVNEVSRMELTMRFRDGHFSLFQLNQIEGLPNFPPSYLQTQPTNQLQAASALLQRYKSASNESYLEEMLTLLELSDGTNGEMTLGNTKLKISLYDGNGEIALQYTQNDADFSAKSVRIIFKDSIITELSDSWFLYNVGNVQVNISSEQAIQIAREKARDFSWISNGTQVKDFVILNEPASAKLNPHPKNENLTLFPYWYITLHLDKVYPGGVSGIAVGVWADTGEVAIIDKIVGTA
jgi:hypothetical protein